MTIQIRLKRNCEKYPDARSYNPIEYKAGEIVPISCIDYPGKLKPTSSLEYYLDVGNDRAPAYRCWLFWVSTDIQDAIIFEKDDIDGVYVDDEIDSTLLVMLRETFPVYHHAPVVTG